MDLTGAQKAAAFLLGVDAKVAAELIRHLDDSAVVKIGKEMVELGRAGDMAQGVFKGVLEDFHRGMNPEGLDERAVVKFLRETLTQARGEDSVDKFLERLGKREERSVPLAPVSLFSPHQLVDLLESEHPQVGALLLSSMGSETALGVLQNLTEERKLELFRRMALLDRPPTEMACKVLAEVCDHQGPGDDLTTAFQDSRVQRLRNLAEILVMQGDSMDKKVLATVAETDEELSKEITELMFTFDDIILIDKKSMQKLLMGVEGKDLSMALKAAGSKVKKHILDNVSSRVRDQIEEEMELLGQVAVSEILEAQRRIAEAARTLIESGEVQVQRGGGA